MEQISNYLTQAGYRAAIQGAAVIVQDPVLVLGSPNRTEYKAVAVRTLQQAVRFVSERS